MKELNIMLEAVYDLQADGVLGSQENPEQLNKIMVVDDDEFMLHMHARALSHKYKLVFAKDG
jgi:hypothetical protein